MKTSEVSESLWNHFSKEEVRIENAYIFYHNWESDLLFIRKKTQRWVEVEVKISRSDFRADFKKPKHKQLADAKTHYFVIPNLHVSEWHFNQEGQYRKCGPNCQLQIKENCIPHQFFYACPAGMIKKEEVPEYAGLYYVDGYKVKLIKKAPVLHSRKVDREKRLSNKLYWKYVNAKEKISRLQSKIERIQIQPELFPTETT